jgi:hypothetical protein
MKIPYRETSLAPNGDKQILENMTSGAAQTSPPEEVLHHKHQQEHWRAIATHYEPILIYGLRAMPSEGWHSWHS